MNRFELNKFCGFTLVYLAIFTFVEPLSVQPSVLFLEEDWPVQKALEVKICSSNSFIGDVRIVAGNAGEVFELVPTGALHCLALKLRQALDTDDDQSDSDDRRKGSKNKHSFELVFEEKSSRERATLDIMVVDVNDNTPVFVNLPAQLKIPANLSVGSVVHQIEVEDVDKGIGGIVRFFLDGSEKFALGGQTCNDATSRCVAELKVRQPLEAGHPEVVSITVKDGVSLTKQHNQNRAVLTILPFNDSLLPTTTKKTIQNTKSEHGELSCSSPKYTATFNRVSGKYVPGGQIFVRSEGFKSNGFEVALVGEFADAFLLRISRASVNMTEVVVELQDAKMLKQLRSPELIFELQLTVNGTLQGMCLYQVKLFSPEDAMMASNHRIPMLKQSQFVVDIEENSRPRVLLNLTNELQSRVMGRIVGEGSFYFVINHHGQLLNLQPLDAEEFRQINLTVAVSVSGESAEAHVTIRVLDQNDNWPKFGKDLYQMEVKENSRAQLQLDASDRDIPLGTQIAGKLAFSCENCPAGVFVSPSTGMLFVSELDAEHPPNGTNTFDVRVRVRDGDITHIAHSTVRIHLEDENDHFPRFFRPSYNISLNCPVLSNSTAPRYPLLILEAIDDDATGNEIRYSLSSNAGETFSVDKVSGQVFLEMEKLPSSLGEMEIFEFAGIATDSGRPQLPTKVPIRIKIGKCHEENNKTSRDKMVEVWMKEVETEMNVQDGDSMNLSVEDSAKTTTSSATLPPTIYAVDVFENSPVGLELLRLELPRNRTFQLVEILPNGTRILENVQHLALQTNGSVRIARPIDFEEVQHIKTEIFPFDSQNASSKSLTPIATIHVNVIDKNDEKPEFFALDYHTSLSAANKLQPGQLFFWIRPSLATDRDVSPAFSNISYSLTPASAEYFSIHPITAEIHLKKRIDLGNLKTLKHGKFELTVKAMDNPNGPPEQRNEANFTIFLYPPIEILPEENSKSSPLERHARLLFQTIPTLIDLSPGNLSAEGPILELPLALAKISQLSISNNDNFILEGNKIRTVLNSTFKVNKSSSFDLSARAKTKGESWQMSKSVSVRLKEIKIITVYWPANHSTHSFKEVVEYPVILTINASSADGSIFYKLENTSNSKDFQIDANGTVRLANSRKMFDYEEQDKFEVIVQICLSTIYGNYCIRLFLHLVVEDVNDNCPFFTSENAEIFTIAENKLPDAKVPFAAFGSAIDRDGIAKHRIICYRLLHNHSNTFALIRPEKPELTVRKVLDRESASEYILWVEVDEHCAGPAVTSGSCLEFDKVDEKHKRKQIIVSVLDENDNIPTFRQQHYFGYMIAERGLLGNEPIVQLIADDGDEEVQGLTYAISSAVEVDGEFIPKRNSPFTVNKINGEVSLLRNHIHTNLLKDTPKSYSFRVTVRDGMNKHEDDAMVTVTVISYKHLVEFAFDANGTFVEANLPKIEKLLNEASEATIVVTEITENENISAITGYFLDSNFAVIQPHKLESLFGEEAVIAKRALGELRSGFYQRQPMSLSDSNVDGDKEDARSEASLNVFGMSTTFYLSEVDFLLCALGVSFLAIMTAFGFAFLWLYWASDDVSATSSDSIIRQWKKANKNKPFKSASDGRSLFDGTRHFRNDYDYFGRVGLSGMSKVGGLEEWPYFHTYPSKHRPQSSTEF